MFIIDGISFNENNTTTVSYSYYILYYIRNVQMLVVLSLTNQVECSSTKYQALVLMVVRLIDFMELHVIVVED